MNPLICFGINPSTAEPGRLDPAMNCVRNTAINNGFDSLVMLNVYPQRATDPSALHREYGKEWKDENERQIARYINGRELTLWAAWGSLIEKRGYLPELLQDIVSLPELQNCRWVSRGELTKGGHPHHPLYLRKDSLFEKFNMKRCRQAHETCLPRAPGVRTDHAGQYCNNSYPGELPERGLQGESPGYIINFP